MGIRKIDINFIILKLNKKKYKNILILGYQNIYFDSKYLKLILNKYRIKDFSNKIKIDNNIEKVDCLELFKNFTDNVDVMDVSDYEGANVIYDLSENPSNLPMEYIDRYDLILDWGTSEHVFNIINCYLNINRMLSESGEFLCLTPMNSMPDHGFYQISPNFYYDFFIKIFKVSYINILQINNIYTPYEQWILYNYTGNCIDHLVNGGIDNKIYFNFIQSFKNDLDIKIDKIYQYQFRQYWKGKQYKSMKKEDNYFNLLGFEFILNLDNYYKNENNSILNLEKIFELNFRECIN